MSSLRETLDEFAKNLVKKAAEKNTNIQESTELFKALTAYYAVLQKNRKSSGDDQHDGPTFDDFSHAVGEHADERSAQTIRNRQRRPS